MMRPARTASLLVAFCLLASPAAASAECAWVLWVRQVAEDEERSPAPKTAFNTKRECVAFVDKLLETPARGVRVDGMKGTTPRTRSVWSDDGKLLHTSEFYCLPDTVDPRGPKGK